ncbi:MAG: hypothetical protein UR19_C0015G0006 [Candidatus Nomurabacteria bacterium GW2011_GWF1_31_48]|uniref:Uncharacterized protein n=1 Tax=Candidatus Nomurabacteria bacterium GW2011_GWF1_31_48 TaxID=1618767 RepID=A0A0G0ARI4_9BACT|nr:MAG: hypothetical protein UR19_C0015G0006 [Candidatus Nomurabacteria bacterium GW2011_GWF1_31_48]
MNKKSAIKKIRGITGGDGLDRSGYPVDMRGTIAQYKWNDGVFTLGFEYGYIKALMDSFEITEDELYGNRTKL